MRLLLELEPQGNGAAGRKFWLAPGERLRVGRTEWADVAIPGDRHLAGVHFEVETAEKHWRVRDLNTFYGTFVNGSLVSEAQLHTGDVISAGNAHFRVAIDSFRNPATPESNAVNASAQEEYAVKKRTASIVIPLHGRAPIGPAVSVPPPSPAQERFDPIWRTREPARKLPTAARPLSAAAETRRGTTLIEQPAGGLRVVLHARSGPRVGFRLWLHANQTLRVGNSELADIAMPDRDMAPVHFELFTTTGTCYVQDLTPGQTFVNDQPLEPTPRQLRHGERVQCGTTMFEVEVEGEQSGDVVPRAVANEPWYAESVTASELTQYTPTAKAPPPLEIARRLSERLPMYLVANLKKTGIPASKPLVDGSDVFADFPQLVRRAQSLYLIGPNDGVDPWDVIARGWGKEAVVILFSTAPKQNLLANVRQAAASYTSPRVLHTQLTASPAPFARQLLGEAESILLETGPESFAIVADPQRWKLNDSPA